MGSFSHSGTNREEAGGRVKRRRGVMSSGDWVLNWPPRTREGAPIPPTPLLRRERKDPRSDPHGGLANLAVTDVGERDGVGLVAVLTQL